MPRAGSAPIGLATFNQFEEITLKEHHLNIFLGGMTNGEIILAKLSWLG